MQTPLAGCFSLSYSYFNDPSEAPRTLHSGLFFFAHQHCNVSARGEVEGCLEVMIPQHGRPLALKPTVSGGGSIPNGPHYDPLFFTRNPAGKSITVNHRQRSAPTEADGRETIAAAHAAAEDF